MGATESSSTSALKSKSTVCWRKRRRLALLSHLNISLTQNLELSHQPNTQQRVALTIYSPTSSAPLEDVGAPRNASTNASQTSASQDFPNCFPEGGYWHGQIAPQAPPYPYKSTDTSNTLMAACPSAPFAGAAYSVPQAPGAGSCNRLL